PAGLKNARSEVAINLFQSRDRHAAGETRRNDRSGGRAADQIEIIAEQQILVRISLLERFLDDLEILERQNAANSAAVQGKDAFRRMARVEVLLLGQRQSIFPPATTLTNRAPAQPKVKNSHSSWQSLGASSRR